MISFTSNNVAPVGDADFDDILKLEQRRQDAMLASDTDTLRTLIAEGAIYIHSSGVVDSDETYLAPLKSGEASYESIDMQLSAARRLTCDTYLLAGRAAIGLVHQGKRIPLDNLFMMVWKKSLTGWMMATWQSTPVVKN
jgi:uncharacterized protein DUF4440